MNVAARGLYRYGGRDTPRGVPFTPGRSVPLWVCLCGARNRLRDLTCRHCGDHKP